MHVEFYTEAEAEEEEWHRSLQTKCAFYFQLNDEASVHFRWPITNDLPS